MKEKKMKKLMKMEKRRKRARGIGALAGTATAFAILGMLYGEDMKKEAKLVAEEAKGKLGL
ncbi:MAG: hypothetical protein IJH62_03625 [Mogibacterium sp.]|nr:hypothetical protein [Mogibacterium sp.]